MSSTRRPLRLVLRTLPARALLYAIGTGCASTARRADATGPTRKAIADFNTCTKPMYPHADLQAGHEGTVHLSFLVDRDGSVGDAKVLRSSGYPALDEAARAAIAKCHFTPALAHGTAVKDWTHIQYVWALN